MRIRECLEPTVVTVPVGAFYRDVAQRLYESGHHVAYVVDEAGALVGVVSEHDLFRILYPFYGSYYVNTELYTDPVEREQKIREVQSHPIERFMQREVHAVHPDDPVMRVGATMLAKNLRRMPVVEQGVILGTVTRQAIFRALYETHIRTESPVV